MKIKYGLPKSVLILLENPLQAAETSYLFGNFSIVAQNRQ